ncbi:MAG TPA: hypothetical protein VNU47_02185 [Candidatus Paceibacterota bacterium]|nr:hypothetical protein [Candidatus Paceibacterota bacterium]
MARKSAKDRIRDYVLAAVLACTIVWLLVLIVGIVRKEERARHAANETEAQLLILKEREMTLQATLDELATARGQEATLRETYGVARPGEEVIIVVPPKEATTTPPLPWWKRTLGWFGIWR